MKRRELIRLSFLFLFAAGLTRYNHFSRSHAIAQDPSSPADKGISDNQEWAFGYRKASKQNAKPVSRAKPKPVCLSPASCDCDDCVSILSDSLKS